MVLGECDGPLRKGFCQIGSGLESDGHPSADIGREIELPCASEHLVGSSRILKNQRHLGAIYQYFQQHGWVVAGVRFCQRTVEDPGGLTVIATRVGLHQGILQG